MNANPIKEWDHQTDPKEWLAKVTVNAMIYRLDEEQSLSYIKLIVKKEYRNNEVTEAGSLKDLQAILENQIATNTNLARAARRKLRRMKLGLTSDPESKKREINQLFRLGGVQTEADKLEILLKMLDDNHQNVIWVRNPRNINDFFDSLQTLRDY